jgi:hypothetical protein
VLAEQVAADIEAEREYIASLPGAATRVRGAGVSTTTLRESRDGGGAGDSAAEGGRSKEGEQGKRAIGVGPKTRALLEGAGFKDPDSVYALQD